MLKRNKTCTETTIMYNVMRTRTYKDMPNAMGIQKDRLQLARSRINLDEKAVFMEHLKGKKMKSDLPGKVRKQSAFLAEDMA